MFSEFCEAHHLVVQMTCSQSGVYFEGSEVRANIRGSEYPQTTCFGSLLVHTTSMLVLTRSPLCLYAEQLLSISATVKNEHEEDPWRRGLCSVQNCRTFDAHCP